MASQRRLVLPSTLASCLAESNHTSSGAKASLYRLLSDYQKTREYAVPAALQKLKSSNRTLLGARSPIEAEGFWMEARGQVSQQALCSLGFSLEAFPIRGCPPSVLRIAAVSDVVCFAARLGREICG